MDAMVGRVAAHLRDALHDYDSAPGLQGRRRYINIQRAEWGTTPHAGSGGVETPTIKVRSNTCPLSRSPASPSLSLSRTRMPCDLATSPPAAAAAAHAHWLTRYTLTEPFGRLVAWAAAAAVSDSAAPPTGRCPLPTRPPLMPPGVCLVGISLSLCLAVGEALAAPGPWWRAAGRYRRLQKSSAATRSTLSLLCARARYRVVCCCVDCTVSVISVTERLELKKKVLRSCF